jgi:hypothetical protein
MKVTVRGETLVIEIEMQTPERSKSGKSMLVASSKGIVKAGVQVQGKELKIGVNAFIEA